MSSRTATDTHRTLDFIEDEPFLNMDTVPWE